MSTTIVFQGKQNLWCMLWMLPFACHAQFYMIDEITSGLSCFTGVSIYSTTQGCTVYHKNASHYFMPASNQKLLTAACALELLGPDYQFATVLATDGFVDGNTLYGNLYLQASGDPSLTVDDVFVLLAMLQDIGVSVVEGNFYLDDTLFDRCAFAPGTTIEDLGAWYYKPVSALMVDGKAVVVNPLNRVDFAPAEMVQELYTDAATFIRMLCYGADIVVNGIIAEQQMPDDVNGIAAYYSLPLVDLLKKCLKESDNLYADCIFKTVGAWYTQDVGSWHSGTHAVRAFLENNVGIAPHDIKIADGSGLSHYNLMTPKQLVHLLRWIYDSDYCDLFLDCLPIGGVDGTLANRLQCCAGKIIAKTGTSGKTSTLSGYAFCDDDLLIFSIMNNNICASANSMPENIKLDVEDQICAAMLYYA